MSEAGAASRFAWGVADLVPLRAKRRTVRLAAGAAAEFACHSKACAPPPVGSGGSGAKSGGKSGFSVLSDMGDPDKVSGWLRETFSYTDPQTGWRTVPDDPRLPAVYRGQTWMVRGDIVDKDGELVGRFNRLLHEDGSVYHDHFTLVPDAQGMGFASRFNAATESAYREAGVPAIRLQAGMSVGGYAWARQGFVMDKNSREFDDALDSLERRIDRLDVDSDVRYTMMEWLRSNEMGKLAASPEGRTVLLGSEWPGVKRLG